MFEPAWKREDPKSEEKAILKLAHTGTGKLKRIVLEAPSEKVAAAAVVELGRRESKSSEDALSEIHRQTASEHIKSVVWLQQQFSDKNPPDKGWHNPSEAVHRCLSYEKSLNVQDVIATLSHVNNSVSQALLLRSLFLYSYWQTFFNEECENAFHQTLHNLYDKGIALSVFLESMNQNGQERLFTPEESRRLKEIYDGNADTAFYFDPHDSYHPYRRNVYSCLVKVWSFYGDEISRQLQKLEPIFGFSDWDDIDFRSTKAQEMAEETQTLLDSLHMTAADIPDEVLYKAKQFGFPMPLQYLYKNGKKEFVETNFRRETVQRMKHFDPEDDRYYTEEEIIIHYSDSEDGAEEV